MDSLSVEAGFAPGTECAARSGLISFNYGHTDPAENEVLLRFNVDRLANAIDKRHSPPDASGSNSVDRLRAQREATVERSSGMVVDTPAWTEGAGYRTLLHAQKSLRINTILVVGHDRLASGERVLAISPCNFISAILLCT